MTGRAVLVLAAAGVFAVGLPASAQEPPREVAVIVTTFEAALDTPTDDNWRYALGVLESDVDPLMFARVFWRGSDSGGPVERVLGGRGLGDRIEAHGATWTVDVASSDKAVRAFIEAMDLSTTGAADAIAHVVATDDPYRVIAAHRRAFVFGVPDVGPTLVVTRGIDPPGDALLAGSGRQPAGLVSPLDVARTLADTLGIAYEEGALGSLLADVPDPDPRAQVVALSEGALERSRWAWLADLAMAMLGVAAVVVLGLLASGRFATGAVATIVVAGIGAPALGGRALVAAAAAGGIVLARSALRRGAIAGAALTPVAVGILLAASDRAGVTTAGKVFDAVTDRPLIVADLARAWWSVATEAGLPQLGARAVIGALGLWLVWRWRPVSRAARTAAGLGLAALVCVLLASVAAASAFAAVGLALVLVMRCGSDARGRW